MAGNHCNHYSFGVLLMAVSPRKGGDKMPITITFHIFGFTVTIRIKGRNRHSGQ